MCLESSSGALYRDARTVECAEIIFGNIEKRMIDFLDTKFIILIMRPSVFAGIAQLVERYLAKV